MGKIIPTANANNVALEQLCAGYSIMTSRGIAAAETTTYMNSMLNELGKSGTTADKVLRQAAGGSFSEPMLALFRQSRLLQAWSPFPRTPPRRRYSAPLKSRCKRPPQPHSRLAASYERVKKNQEKLASIAQAQQKNNEAISKTKTQLAGTLGTFAAVGAAIYAGQLRQLILVRLQGRALLLESLDLPGKCVDFGKIAL